MKRLLSTALLFAMALTLVSCGGGNASSDSTVGSQSNVHSASSSVSSEPIISNSESTDGRGIPGMSTFAIRAVLEGSPFGIPMTEDVPAPVEATESYASSCTSSGPASGNVLYDYSITMDSDGEIIGASFGITSITANESEMLNAADLFFYTVSQISYDTADKDTLVAWFEETIPAATTDGTSITVGDAVYHLYGNPGLLYFVDISKNT